MHVLTILRVLSFLQIQGGDDMSSWGISPSASELEKIKSEYADYLNGENSCGNISYSVYSEAFDVGTELIEKSYKLAIEELSKQILDELSYETVAARTLKQKYYDMGDFYRGNRQVEQIVTLSRVKKIINNSISTNNRGSWVYCGDGNNLPPKYEWVNVTFEISGMDEASNIRGVAEANYGITGWEFRGLICGRVVAWRPLPYVYTER